MRRNVAPLITQDPPRRKRGGSKKGRSSPAIAKAARENGLKGGRPRYIKTPQEFSRKVDEYVKHCVETGEPVLWTGMALHMGFSSRIAFYDYMKYEGFADAVKRAILIIEKAYEFRLATGANSAGAMFALYNLGGWQNPRYDVRATLNSTHTERREIAIDWGKVPDDVLDTLMDAMLSTHRQGNGVPRLINSTAEEVGSHEDRAD